MWLERAAGSAFRKTRRPKQFELHCATEDSESVLQMNDLISVCFTKRILDAFERFGRRDSVRHCAAPIQTQNTYVPGLGDKPHSVWPQAPCGLQYRSLPQQTVLLPPMWTEHTRSQRQTGVSTSQFSHPLCKHANLPWNILDPSFQKSLPTSQVTLT